MGDVIVQLFGIHFHDTITLGGVIVSILVGLTGLAWIGFAVRWRNLYLVEKATSETNLEGRNAYERAAKRLGGEKDELQKKLAIAEALPHYEDLMTALADHFTKIDQAMEKHELRDLERHEATLAALEALADRIKESHR